MKGIRNLRIILALTIVIGSTALLFGCGGGGGGTSPSANGTISGTAVKGPVSGGTVRAYAIDNGTTGPQLVSATTDTQGNFTMNIGGYAGPVMLQLSGGTYIDEATGTVMTMAPGDVMTAVISSATGTTMSGIQITPLTSMAQAMAQNMSGGMTEANITAANAAIGTYFMVNDILHTQPMNPLAQGSGSVATPDARNYGMTIAAMTQYANTIGMTDSSGIVTAMMDDASDGVMDGKMDGTSITMGGGMMGGTMTQSAGTSGLANAMTTFIGSTMNKSGVTITNMQTLIDQLNASSGQIQGTGTGTTGANGMIGGTVFTGPVKSATVMAFAVNNGTVGAQLASGTTDTQGNFTMSLGTYSGPLMLRMTGATYTDLATGATTTTSMGDVMTAVISSVTSGETVTGIQITPLTSMAQARAQYMTGGGMTAANITSANTAVGNYFKVNDILHTQPMNPLTQGSGTGATADAQDYGMTIAAMLRYAQSIGMTDPSAIITAMMEDASDGVMDGKMGGTSITMGGGMMGGTMMPSTAGTSGLADAMTTFINNTSVNKSGLTTTDMQALITTLSNSTGTIQ